MCVFPRILSILPLLPCQQRAAIGCSENGQLIGVTVHSRFAQISLRGIGCSGFEKKPTNIIQQPVHSIHSYNQPHPSLRHSLDIPSTPTPWSRYLLVFSSTYYTTPFFSLHPLGCTHRLRQDKNISGESATQI